jgi:twitching motility protein PilT
VTSDPFKRHPDDPFKQDTIPLDLSHSHEGPDQSAVEPPAPGPGTEEPRGPQPVHPQNLPAGELMGVSPGETPAPAQAEAVEPEVESAEREPAQPAVAEVDEALAERVRNASSPRHKLEAWLAIMVQEKASDLILRASGRPCVRVDSRIRFLPGRVPAAGALIEVLEGIVGTERMEHWRKTGSVDTALHLDGLGRFRLNAYKQMGEPAVVLRHVAEAPPELDTLHLPHEVLQELALRRRGIVLVTGIAGSGKSTTLAAMIQHMNRVSERHVVTLEDPVELIYREERCVISQREIGTDCPDFHDGLRHALRQSPDVILIGEMRDAETVSAALDATETGHLVFSTLHTVNAAQTVDRIVSFFEAEQHEQVRQRLAENLAAVLSQRLLPRIGENGMVPAVELMQNTPRIRELLEKGRTGEIGRAISAGGEEGLISFNRSLRHLVTSQMIDLDTALSASDRPEELLLALRGYSHGGERRGTDRRGSFRMSGE